jgi:hypothetical protein
MDIIAMQREKNLKSNIKIPAYTPPREKMYV